VVSILEAKRAGQPDTGLGLARDSHIGLRADVTEPVFLHHPVLVFRRRACKDLSQTINRFFRSNLALFIDRILRLGQCVKCAKLYLGMAIVQVGDSHNLGEVSAAN
jgi:hypothetical protein